MNDLELSIFDVIGVDDFKKIEAEFESQGSSPCDENSATPAAGEPSKQMKVKQLTIPFKHETPKLLPVRKPKGNRGSYRCH